ncbi:MAG: helix-turn-helix domain-containing protein [Anaerolineae bacterium]|nr:helix-turn-helix domain-containing protein [Anaerolineae bacterium]
MPDSDFLTVDEACDLLGVKKATLYSYVSRGLVKSYKQGIRRQRLYNRAELEALLTVRPGEAEPAETGVEAESETGLPRADEWVGDR